MAAMSHQQPASVSVGRSSSRRVRIEPADTDLYRGRLARGIRGLRIPVYVLTKAAHTLALDAVMYDTPSGNALVWEIEMTLDGASYGRKFTSEWAAKDWLTAKVSQAIAAGWTLSL
jgi:hypothetical protein